MDKLKRYNKLGEWKPIIFVGDTDAIQKEINQLSDNSKVRGILFYNRTTGFNCIEFVMKTSVDLPFNGINSIDNILHIYKCPSIAAVQESVIYDCWLELSSLDPKKIESELQRIRLAVNRIGIAFNTPIDWCIKYDCKRSVAGKALPTQDDLSYLNDILVATVNNNDLYLIEYSIDWFNQAQRTKNPFTKYLCYFTAIECLVTKIADGNTDFHKGIAKLSRAEKIKCIEQLEKDKRTNSILQFIHESYEICLLSINRKFKIILPSIFGETHWGIKSFFEGDNSLIKIRNKIVHGEYSLYNGEHELVVQEKISDIAALSKEFILRLLLKKNPSEEMPKWGNMYSSSLSMADPRNTLVCSTENVFPISDWRIKPEWCS